jgi:hypothetical protein
MAQEVYGVYIRELRTLYVLDNGGFRVANPIDRIQKALTSRGILKYTGKPEDLTERSYVMKLSEAEEKGYKIEKIVFTQHISSVLASQEEAVPKRGNGWNRKTKAEES